MQRYRRELFRFAGVAFGGLIALALATVVAHALLPAEVAEFILVPLGLLWFIFFTASGWGYGPMGQRLKRAAEEDRNEENKKLIVRQPWDNHHQ